MSKQMGADKDTNKLIRAARKQGWEVSITKGNHVKFVPPGSGDIIFGALTGSITGQRMLKRQLQKAGVAA